MTKNEPSLDDLGLGEPVKLSNKISIERLQRESEHEMASARPPVVRPADARNVGLDVAACIVTLLVPGSGHMVKGHWLAGFLCLVCVVGLLFLFFPLAIIAQIFCVVSAATISPKS